MFFGNVCPKAESSRAWSGCRYDRGKTRPLGTGRDVPICLSPLRFVVFPIFRPSFRLCPPVPDRLCRSGTGGLRLFSGDGISFFLIPFVCSRRPIKSPFGRDRHIFAEVCIFKIQDTPCPRSLLRRGVFSPAEKKVKKFDVFFGILRKVYLFYDIITNIIKITFRA